MQLLVFAILLCGLPTVSARSLLQAPSSQCSDPLVGVVSHSASSVDSVSRGALLLRGVPAPGDCASPANLFSSAFGEGLNTTFPWLQLKLNASKSVTCLRVWLPLDSAANASVFAAYVFASESSQDDSLPLDKAIDIPTCVVLAAPGQAAVDVTCPSALPGSFVVLQSERTSPLRLCAVQVFGTPADLLASLLPDKTTLAFGLGVGLGIAACVALSVFVISHRMRLRHLAAERNIQELEEHPEFHAAKALEEPVNELTPRKPSLWEEAMTGTPIATRRSKMMEADNAPAEPEDPHPPPPPQPAPAPPPRRKVLFLFLSL